jgi:hypothetical protein
MEHLLSQVFSASAGVCLCMMSRPQPRAKRSFVALWVVLTMSVAARGQTPTVTGVSPAIGPATGGSAVMITGTNFTAGSTVSFGGSPATQVLYNSATSLTAIAPSFGAASVNVTVTTAGEHERDEQLGLLHVCDAGDVPGEPVGGFKLTGADHVLRGGCGEWDEREQLQPADRGCGGECAVDEPASGDQLLVEPGFGV